MNEGWQDMEEVRNEAEKVGRMEEWRQLLNRDEERI